jgi:tRNA-2-methylthio-N6-dimethylallyladenosine synthase
VVPYTRGPERSRTSESVLKEARELARMGYVEIQLLGQNVNSYRDPSPAGWDFARLLRAVGEIDGIRRVRFTTSHPRDFVRDIIDAIDENPVLCNHVHLPVQSGSTRLLDRMQRLYSRADYLRRIEWMKNARRNISITTDIIVGFPGETEDDFEATLSLLDEVQYDSLFSFKYSRRPNTPALALDDHIAEEEKGRRLAILQEKQRIIQIRRNSELVGSVEEAFVEGYNHATGQWIGRTSQNRTLNFIHARHAGPQNGETLAGRFCNVRVTRAGPNSLAGEAVN